MKTLTEYIIERGPTPKEDDVVFVLKDKDLDGAIFDVCDTEEDAQRLLDMKKKENPDVHMEIVPGKRSEFVKE